MLDFIGIFIIGMAGGSLGYMLGAMSRDAQIKRLQNQFAQMHEAFLQIRNANAMNEETIRKQRELIETYERMHL